MLLWLIEGEEAASVEAAGGIAGLVLLLEDSLVVLELASAGDVEELGLDAVGDDGFVDEGEVVLEALDCAEDCSAAAWDGAGEVSLPPVPVALVLAGGSVVADELAADEAGDDELIDDVVGAVDMSVLVVGWLVVGWLVVAFRLLFELDSVAVPEAPAESARVTLRVRWPFASPCSTCTLLPT